MANLNSSIVNGFLKVLGKINATDSITAPSFIGSLTGNADTATKLETARTIGVSGVVGVEQSFDGTKNIVIPITSVSASLITEKNLIKGSEISNDKNWIPSNDNTVTNFVSMTSAELVENAGNLPVGTVVVITDGVEGYVTTQDTSLSCDLPLDL